MSETQANNRQHTLGPTSILSGIPLFAGLSAEMLQSIESHAIIRNYRRNTVVIEQGGEATYLYVLVSGRVRVYLAEQNGKELVLNTLGPGAHFGELALLGDNERSASVMTQEDSKFLVISKKSFTDFLHDHPEITIDVIHHLVQQIRDLTERVGVLGLRDVYGRVAATLQAQAHEEDGRLITASLTQQELAQMVGASREMVSRILKDLKLGGYIDIESKRIIINKKLPLRW